MLVGHLPEDSALSTSMRGGRELRPWSTQTYLLAGVVNLLNAANRQRAGQRTRKPLIEPPTPSKRKRRTVSVGRIAANATRALTGR